MSFSFIIIDLNNKIDLEKTLNEFEKNYTDFEVIYCSSAKINKTKNVKSFVFDANENSEKILNAVTKEAEKKNIVVVRKFTSVDDIKKQTKSLLLSNQIVFYQKSLNSFQNFFWNILRFFIKLIIFKDFVLCNFNCVTYGEIASNVLKKIEYPSNLMRTNQWQGVQMVGLDGGEKYKFKYNKTKNILSFIIPLLLMIICILVFCIFKSKLDILLNIVLWLVAIICIVVCAVFGVNWFIKSQIGENILEKSKIKEELKNEKN